MAKAPTPEETEKLKAFALKFHHTREKLLAKRDQVKELLADTNARLRHYAEGSVPREYLGLQRQLLEISLANLEVYPLESPTFNPVAGAFAPAYEGRMLELKLVGLRMDLLAMGELLALADGALAPAVEEAPPEAPVATPAPGLPGARPRSIAGQTGRLKPQTGRLSGPGTGRLQAAAALPPGWDEEAVAIAADPERRALWERYRSDVLAFREAAAQAAEAEAELAPPDSPALRLKQLKALKVPVLNGLAYRVNTALKHIPGGEAYLKAVRDQIVPPVGRGKPVSKKPVTDRLLDFFKPPS